MAHRRHEVHSDVKEVAMDYAFIRRLDEKATQAVLIMKDRASRALRGWLPKHKGV